VMDAFFGSDGGQQSQSILLCAECTQISASILTIHLSWTSAIPRIRPAHGHIHARFLRLHTTKKRVHHPGDRDCVHGELPCRIRGRCSVLLCRRVRLGRLEDLGMD